MVDGALQEPSFLFGTAAQLLSDSTRLVRQASTRARNPAVLRRLGLALLLSTSIVPAGLWSASAPARAQTLADRFSPKKTDSADRLLVQA